MFVKIQDGAVATYPYSVGQLRRDNPNTSFPKSLPTSTLEAYGVYSVVEAGTPPYDDLTQRIKISDQPELVGGVWTLTKTVIDLTSDQIAAKNTAVASINREKRNKLLADSDWTQMNDSPLANEAKTAWATYRQELRDLSDLAAWPNLGDDDWPVAP